MSEHPNRDTQREQIAQIVYNNASGVDERMDSLDAADELLAAGLIVSWADELELRETP